MIELRYVKEGRFDTGKVFRGYISVEHHRPMFVYFSNEMNRWIVESLDDENGKPNFVPT